MLTRRACRCIQKSFLWVLLRLFFLQCIKVLWIGKMLLHQAPLITQSNPLCLIPSLAVRRSIESSEHFPLTFYDFQVECVEEMLQLRVDH